MEDLIQTDRPPSVGARVAASLAAALTLAVLVGTGVADAVNRIPAPRLVGQEAQEVANARASRDLWNGSWAHWVETELRIRSRVRTGIAPYWSALLLRYGRMPADGAVGGSDGWLFSRLRAELDRDLGVEWIELAGRLLASARRRIEARGIELCVLPLPRKSAVCADRLPPGFDAWPQFDRLLIDRMRATGVSVVDVMDAWSDAPSEEIYLGYDSHWALGAQEILANAVVAAYPGFVRDVPAPEVVEVDGPPRSGLLEYHGIPVRHRANRLLDLKPSKRMRVPPLSLDMRLAEGVVGSSVALAGTSFTASYDLGRLLAIGLGRDLHIVGLRGGAFLEALASLGEARADANDPELLLYEVPAHSPIELERPSLGVRRAFGRLAAVYPPVGERSLTLANVPPAMQVEGGPPAVWRLAPGTVLGSGDGVVSVAVEVVAPAATRWGLRTDGMTVEFEVPAGGGRCVVPFVQRKGGAGFAVLTAVGRGPVASSIKVDVLTDVDLDAQRPAPRRTPEGALGAAAQVDPLDALFVRWEGRPKVVAVEARGRSASGEELRETWEVARPRSRVAIFSLGRFEGGQLTAVTVSAPDASAHLAPIARY
ncbi:MAG: hypothetical protein AAF957_02215 [Planctomycetota bacterium]